MSFIEKAKSLAEERHSGQCRPNLGREPKIVHIGEVASLVEKAGGSDQEISAAWLHDIIEDTATTLEEIENIFGQEIAEIVDGLTDPKGFERLPLLERKEKQAERLLTKSKSVKLIKICDQYSNCLSVLNDPPLDWPAEKSLVYFEGAKKLADICCPVSETMYESFINIYNEGALKYKEKQ